LVFFLGTLGFTTLLAGALVFLSKDLLLAAASLLASFAAFLLAFSILEALGLVALGAGFFVGLVLAACFLGPVVIFWNGSGEKRSGAALVLLAGFIAAGV